MELNSFTNPASFTCSGAECNYQCMSGPAPTTQNTCPPPGVACDAINGCTECLEGGCAWCQNEKKCTELGSGVGCGGACDLSYDVLSG
eukprot:CAMPEP_0114550318 /NCGR_PEP_ID=MMETSP0114-20121206/6010_1 /TAXON_ID=31324 /ORGANISM="Goniomonas sp, Strain m" /LENGTH=87 /DNA_ID=CAMNT_0001735085 /DNA_START=659 /DNA_END=919 /DNA_ORIENTATION=+